MSINPLNDISKVYLDQVASVDEALRSREERMARMITPAKRKEQERIRKGREILADIQATERALKQPKSSASTQPTYDTPPAEVRVLKPGQKKDTLAMKAKKAMGEAKETPKRWWDDDGDDIGYEKGEVSGKFKRKKKVEEDAKPNDGNLANNYPPYDKVTRGDVIAGATGKDQMGGKKKKITKEGYSNWREDLIEVIGDIPKDKNDERIVEKEVDNKIKINPNFGEAVEELGGTLLEMVEIGEMDYIVESVYDELLDEGYDENDIEEALEFALTEAKVTFGHDTSPKGTEKKRSSLLAAAKQKLSSVKKAAKQAVASGARKVAKRALGVARKMEGGDKNVVNPRSKGAKPVSAPKRPPSAAGTKERVSSGSYKGPEKKTTEKPADPWEGSATTPAKPKAKPAAKKPATPKAKPKTTKVTGGTSKAPARKRKSKLDSLLADIRSEQVQIDEKTLSAAETKEKERIVKSMKDKAADFEKRYPGRGKEVMYATATKMAKKIAEQAMEIQPKTQEKPDQAQKKMQQSQDRMRQQEVQIIQRKLQALRSAPKGTDPSITAGYEPEGKMIDEQEYTVITKSGKRQSTKKPLWKASPAALVKPIKPTGRSRYRDENPYRARPGESD